ncbi:hypothetical protein IF1G_04595 [Cordyceps javanica]|uniref:Uncharacterized protein n=1 Tax=Cordyceps javanica TaxID=43265 RepID=A0A545V6L9_9HYPO|nr:hypothetical protein IF1G_04595 [Cordyceps javanica]TQW08592.1 hypothetical protein IF2G_04468 [Cordyceps javanica]
MEKGGPRRGVATGRDHQGQAGAREVRKQRKRTTQSAASKKGPVNCGLGHCESRRRRKTRADSKAKGDSSGRQYLPRSLGGSLVGVVPTGVWCPRRAAARTREVDQSRGEASMANYRMSLVEMMPFLLASAGSSRPAARSLGGGREVGKKQRRAR